MSNDEVDLAEAFEQIGAYAEHNLEPDACARLVVALRLLTSFVEHTGHAKLARQMGRIVEAKTHETDAEAAYQSLPQPYRW